MKENLHKLIVALAFLSVVVLTFVSASLGLFDKVYEKLSTEDELQIDWSQEYEFDEPREKEKTSFVETLTSPVTNMIKLVDNYYNSNIPIMTVLYDVFGNVNKALSRRMIENSESDTYLLDNSYLTFATEKEDVSENAESIVKLKEFLDKKNIDYLSVLTPKKSDERFAEFPYGIESYYGENNEEYIKILEENDVEYLDMTREIVKDKLDFFQQFFYTDHHWKVGTGLWAAEKIVSKTNELYKTDFDASLLDKSNFTSKVYEDCFLGSEGKKATTVYSPAEDFEIFYPNFETAFNIKIPTLKLDKSGNFGECLIDEGLLDGDYDLYADSLYEAVMYGDRALINVTNNLSSNDKKVLILKRSMADFVTPYLACAAKELDIVDLRYFNGNIYKYIEDTKPDIVITIYSNQCDELTK